MEGWVASAKVPIHPTSRGPILIISLDPAANNTAFTRLRLFRLLEHRAKMIYLLTTPPFSALVIFFSTYRFAVARDS
jgi:hypothetical protein